jgi:hypothetical protein
LIWLKLWGLRACPTIQTPSSKRTECFRNMELFAVEENICWTSPGLTKVFILLKRISYRIKYQQNKMKIKLRFHHQ